MSNKEKEIVTYIKNGQEVTKTLNFLNKKRILRSLFKFEDGGYCTDSDIEFVQLKNCKLLDFFALKGPKKGKIIFDNCIFKSGLGNLGPKCMIIGGNKIELLNPKLDNFTTIMVKEGKDIKVEFDDSYKIKMGNLEVIKSEKVFIEDNNAITELHIDNAGELKLEGNFDVDSFSVNGDKVSIVDKK